MKNNFVSNISEEFKKVPLWFKVVAGLAGLVLVGFLGFSSFKGSDGRGDESAQATPSTSASESESTPSSSESVPYSTGTAVANEKKLFADQPEGNLQPDDPKATMSDEDRDKKYNSTPLVLNEKGLPVPTDTKDPNRYMADYMRAKYTFDTSKASYDDYAANMATWFNTSQKLANQTEEQTVKAVKTNAKRALRSLNISSADDWERLALDNTKFEGKVMNFSQPPNTGTAADIHPDPNWLKFNTRSFGVFDVIPYMSSDAPGGQVPGSTATNVAQDSVASALWVDCPNPDDTELNEKQWTPLEHCAIRSGADPARIEHTDIWDASNPYAD
ncbi:MAG: hypothetical protein QM571_02940 [Micrococcaceae bacterium]